MFCGSDTSKTRFDYRGVIWKIVVGTLTVMAGYPLVKLIDKYSGKV
jgi:CO dehydrogenase/acetyl-CoA synthase delta subunit